MLRNRIGLTMSNGCKHDIGISGNPSQLTDMSFMFSSSGRPGWDYITEMDLSKLDTSNVTDMIYMFFGCDGLTSINMSNWDIRNVPYNGLYCMFSGCTNLNEITMDNWVLPNRVDLQYVFSGATKLTTLNAKNWNLNQTNSTNNFFRDCEVITKMDLSGWKTNTITNMSYMFYGCGSLTSLDLTDWDISNVTDMSSMFRFCGLTELRMGGNPKNLMNVTNMFYGAGSYNYSSKDKFYYNSAYDYSKIIDELDLSTWEAIPCTLVNGDLIPN